MQIEKENNRYKLEMNCKADEPGTVYNFPEEIKMTRDVHLRFH